MAITQTFSQSTLVGTSISNPTSLQFGPDGRLYVSQQNGQIKVYDITKVGDTWQASNEQVITLVNDIPNHNDDGALSSTSNRQVTGLIVEGTPENPILYVSSSDPRIGAGGGGNDVGLDTNSGIISRLTPDTNGDWEVNNNQTGTKVDLVIGLPRSEENHSTNGMDIRTEFVDGEPHQIMYVMSGGHDNKGSPSNNFAYTPEYYYSAAMLRVDLTQIAQIEADEGLKGGTAYVDEYVYALPTLDDPTRTNVSGSGDGAVDSAVGTTGSADFEAGDTFGGNDGRNQAKFDPNGPVQVYSPGYRNAYDVVITEAGNLYTFDNGPNNGWGGGPVSDDGVTEVTSDTQVATNAPNLTDNTNDSDPDNLHIVQQGTYGGHPNPTRASGAAAGLWSGQGGGLSEDVQLTPIGDSSNDPGTVWDDLPEDWSTITGGDTNPIEGVYFGPDNSPGPKDESLLSIGSSTNGITEYSADNIGDGGPGVEYLATVSFNGALTLIEVQTDGTAGGSTVTDTNSINIGGTPLDVTALGNSGIPGSAGLGAGAMFVAQIGSNGIVVLEPGDPPGVDLDADNDGVLDKNDPLQFDANNGTQTILQGGETLFWDFNPAAGNFPGPDGEYNIGMNGWMIDGAGEINPDVLNETPGADLLTDLDNTIRGGAPGVIQIKSVSEGDAYQGVNTQNDALQTGFTPAPDVGTFTIRVPVFNPYSSVGLDENFGSVGFALGDGTQANYLKVVAGVGGGAARLQVYYEENDGSVVDITVDGAADSDFADAATNATGNAIFELYLTVDLTTPGAATAQAFYNYELTPGGGMELSEPKAIGGLIALQGAVLEAVLGQKTITAESGAELPSSAIVTLLATSTGPETPFEANFVDLEITSTVQQVAPVAAEDEASTSPDQSIDIPVADLLANDSDGNLDILTVASVQNPVNGTVVLNDAGTGDPSDDFVTFTPTPSFEGVATFDYTVSDGTGLTSDATVTVNVADNTLLYRVNAGGALVAATDGLLDWAANTGAGAQSGSGFSVNTGSISTHPTAGRAGPGDYELPGYAPQAIFSQERWDPTAEPEMQWDFVATTTGFYTINLFMANGFDGTSAAGQRVFDILIEGQLVEDDLDLAATLGHQIGGMFTYEVEVTDGILDIDFARVVENPLINGIEIYGPAPGGPAPDTTAPVIATVDVQPLSTQPGNDQPISVFVTFTDDEGLDVDSILGTTLSVTGGPVGSDPTIVSLPGAADGDTTIVAEYIVDAPDGGWPANTPYTFEVSGVEDEAGNAVTAASEGYTFVDAVAPGAPLYRINAGGAEIANPAGGIAWSEDQSAGNANGTAQTGTPSPYLDLSPPATDTTFGAALAASFTNNTTLPDSIFSTERYSETANPDNMSWDFAVANGDFLVNLYFAEVWTGAQDAGSRVFDVEIEGQLMLDDFDITAQFGWNVAEAVSIEVTVTDGNLDLDFLKGAANNPKVSAIEILVAETDVPAPVGQAVLTVNDGANGIEASNFGANSFQITNTGEKDIFAIEIDVADALFPDAVFDPFGLAGDLTAKILQINAEGGTGVITPAGGFGQSAIGVTYIGEGGASGFEKIRLEFTDFNPGETLGFSIDMDPNSIAGSVKSTLDSGAPLAGAGNWDVGGIAGGELIGSSFFVEYEDASISTGKLHGQGAGQQMGASALSTQASENLDVTLTVNGLIPGAEGTYGDGGPQILIQGPADEVARVLVAKGFIVPFTNNFAESDPYKAQLDAQIQALEASGFPANNAVELLYVDVLLTGDVQDISGLFDFTQVVGFDLSVPDQTNEFGILEEDKLPLGIVASVIDPATDLPKGEVTSPIHIRHSDAAPNADLSLSKTVSDVNPDFGDTVTFTITVMNDGPDAASGVVIEHLLGDGFDLDEASIAESLGAFDDATGLWAAGDLAAGASATLTFNAIVLEGDVATPDEVLYRVNVGGPELAAADGSAQVWTADTGNFGSATASQFLAANTTGGSTYNGDAGSAHPGDITVDPSVSAAVPIALFNTERYDASAAPEMLWRFPILEPTTVEVRLYFAELFGSIDQAGERVFDVMLEGEVPPVFDDIDSFATAGAKGGFVRVAEVEVTDGMLDIEFIHGAENPAVKGIEIIMKGGISGPLDYASTAEVIAAIGDDPDSTPGNGVIGEDDDASIVVAPVAGGTNAVSIASVTNAAEPETAGQFVITLEEVAETETIVTYVVAGTATAGEDYVALTGTATIPQGQISVLIDVTLLPDLAVEGEETVEITLTGAAGDANLGLGTISAAVTIADDETPPVTGGALIEITPGGDLGATTFGGSDKLQITNTGAVGDANIASITFDFSTGILPDMVFDPTGSGGDSTAQGFTAGGTAAAVGLIAPGVPLPDVGDNDADPFSQPRNGGWDKITLNFTDFNPGETFTFTADIDPNSIQGVAGAGAAGAVSGYELIGSTVTITFSDGTEQQVVASSLFQDGSLGGSVGLGETVVSTSVVLSAPVIELVGVGVDASSNLPGDQVYVPEGQTSQMIRITGAPGATVTLLQMDARLFIASGDAPFDVLPDELPFYANEATAGKVLYTALLDENGEALAPVTLLATPGAAGTPDGGLNHFVAVLSEGPYEDGSPISMTSNTLVVTEAPAVEISIEATADAAEPDSDGLFTVSIAQASSVDTVIAYTVAGSATEGVDYAALSGEVVIPANQLSATIAIDVLEDGEAEIDESVEVTLTDVLQSNGLAMIGAADSATAVIVSQELNTPPVVTTEDSFEFVEGDTAPAFIVAADDAEGDALTFEIGGADADLFMFDAGTGAVSFITPPDFIDDGDNVFELTVTASDGLLNSDAQPITVTLLKDSDDDLVADIRDNAIFAFNPTQLDSDQDGYGNIIDADLDQTILTNPDAIVGFGDFVLFREAFGSSTPVIPGDPSSGAAADFDGDGTVGFSDFVTFRGLFGQPLGQSYVDIDII
ncbi:MAG: malectin domain-containing carbohydrate-binding protein [Rhodospirillaceae bacterium]